MRTAIHSHKTKGLIISEEHINFNLGYQMIPNILFGPDDEQFYDYYIDSRAKSTEQASEIFHHLPGSPPIEILNLASRLVEETYTSHEQTSIHAGALTDGKKTHLIMGPNHAGKSTICYHLSKMLSIHYLTGDRAVLQQDKIIGGNIKDSLREASINDQGRWDNLITISPDTYIPANPMNINTLFFIQLSNRDDYQEVNDPIKKLAKIYPSTTYFLNTYPAFIYSLNKPILPPQESSHYEYRYEIAKLLSEKPLVTVTGSKDYIAEIINKEGFN